MRGAVKLEGVGVAFHGASGRIDALMDVDLDVAAGEFVTIVGPSGCGKSTILNLVAGLDKPTTGRVLVDGEPVTGPGADRILVFQEHALFPWLDVQGNVEFGLRLAGMGREERQAHAAKQLELVHLERFAHARIHELSGGMKQRVAIARALALKPRVLLMDEPFAALDAMTRDDLLGKLQEIWGRERITVLFVTHNVREAAVLGDRVVVLSRRPGRVQDVLEASAPHPRALEDHATADLARRVKRSLGEVVDEIAGGTS